MSRPRVGYRGGLALLLTPFAAGALVLVVLPAIASAYFAVTRYDGLSPPRVVGPVVFSELLADPEVHDSLRATAIIAGLAVPLRLLGALGLAMLLHRRERLAAAGGSPPTPRSSPPTPRPRWCGYGSSTRSTDRWASWPGCSASTPARCCSTRGARAR
jgi:hypothetical protein